MWAFIAVTIGLFLCLVFSKAAMNMEEIMANWSKYKSDPFYMFAAPMFKPHDDPRSRLQFATDNFHDVVSEMITKVFAVMLQPLFQIFKLFMDALTQSLSGLFNIKALLENMWKKWNQMTDIFQRRFNGVFHNFRLTFIRIFNAMEKSYAIAIASVNAGMSTIHSMTSFLDLVIKIIITILVILVVMVILLFFVLAPFIPLVLSTIGIIAATAMGGAVGGMAGAFCFTGDALIHTANGPIRIDKIKLGQQLNATNKVTGVLKFKSDTYDLYYLDGIAVSGSHIVYHNAIPIHVKNHPKATRLPKSQEELYCLITSEHIIPIVGSLEMHMFADWEELDTLEELQTWYSHVYQTLNGTPTDEKVLENVLESEAAVAKGTLVSTVYGPKCIESLRPGDRILAGDGTPTTVLGIVQLDPSSVVSVTQFGNSFISTGSWVETEGIWKHPAPTAISINSSWYSLFTDKGTYRIETSKGTVNLRDFSDIGKDTLEQTYDMVLSLMDNRAFFQNDV
jgi:hypothetical protein